MAQNTIPTDRSGPVAPLPPLLVAGPFPPPVHGFSAMTAALSAEIGKRRDVELCDLSSAHPAAIVRHLSQTARCLCAALHVVSFRMRGGHHFSIGANAGWGMLYTLVLVAVAKAAGLRIFLHHHSYAYINQRSVLMAFLTAIGGKRLQHVFLAQAMERAFFARYPQKSTALLLSNALFVPPGQPRAPRSGAPIRVGLLSNLGAEKGLYDFIETARRLKAGSLQVEMVLAGPASRTQDAKAIRAAVAEGLLQACGPLYGTDKDTFFEGLDLFLFPTRYVDEAQPTVIYEALAAGVPVLAFARGAIADQVRDCLTTLPVGADFASGAVAIIQTLAGMSKAERHRISAAATARHAQDQDQGSATLTLLATIR